ENLWSMWRNELKRQANRTLPSRNAELSYRRAGAALRRAIWDPIAAELGNATEGFVVPDGVLHLVTLDSLPFGERKYLAEAGKLFHYLSAERDVTLTSSTHGTGLLALGNPDFNRA